MRCDLATTRLAFAVMTSCLAAVVARAAEPAPPALARTFIEQHCIECHDADVKKGDLDLTAVSFDPASGGKAFDQWVKVHDRVRDGEMPPPKKGKPGLPHAEVDAFLKSIAEPMILGDQARVAKDGRASWRRLNRYEYENAVRDLLGAPWLQLKEMLPDDGESHRFNKAGEALAVSHVHMASYLAAAEHALRKVAASGPDRPPTTTTRYYAREQRSFRGKMIFNQFNRSPDRATFPLLDSAGQPDVLEGKAPITVGPKDPAVREREAFGVVASTYEPLEIRFDQFHAPVGGRYRLRFATHTFWASPESDAKWWVPSRAKLSAGRRDEPVVIYSETVPRLLRRLGAFDATPEPAVREMIVDLVAGETIRPDAARLFRSRPPAWKNPLAQGRDGMPGVAFRWLEVEGPLYDDWPTAGHKLLFGDLPLKPPATPGDVAEVVSASARSDAERLLRQFMAKAYRRPAPDAEVGRFLAVVNGALKGGVPFNEAMIAGYGAVLCSPNFLCVEEPAGRLDDYALASRLSLFLWNSTPDGQLLALAEKGELSKPDVLRAQTDRLLADPRSRRFVDAFLDYWLDLRKIQATSPDATLYPDYYLDDLLADSSVEESQLFFAELLRGDLPASNLVASDFAMLNERLARHYGVPGVTGVGIRRVPLPSGSVRGGLMTQAAVLKVTANGTTTSPVVRGAWVMERLLGKPPPPPPPSVPAIEPDTRGATTIREQLDKHRALPACAGCHTKIDPAGFALESFDVMGGWRQNYRAVASAEGVTNRPPTTTPPTSKPASPDGFGHNGQKFEFHDGPPVDPSGVLPDGRAFRDVAGLKQLLLQDRRQLARNLVGQLLVYGTGAAVRFGDRPAVEAILDRAAKGDYGVRTLVHEVVQSELFRAK